MAKDELVLDLFFGQYIGGLDDKKTSNKYPNRKKPVIKELNTDPTQIIGRSNKEEFPYALDPEKNIKRIDGYADFPIVLLIPDGDVPDLTQEELENTVWYGLREDQEDEAEKWQEKYEEKDKELERVRKEKRELLREKEQREEREKASKSSNSNNVKCPNCDTSNPQSNWEDNNGYCPSCGDKTLDEVKG